MESEKLQEQKQLIEAVNGIFNTSSTKNEAFKAIALKLIQEDNVSSLSEINTLVSEQYNLDNILDKCGYFQVETYSVVLKYQMLLQDYRKMLEQGPESTAVSSVNDYNESEDQNGPQQPAKMQYYTNEQFQRILRDKRKAKQQRKPMEANINELQSKLNRIELKKLHVDSATKCLEKLYTDNNFLYIRSNFEQLQVECAQGVKDFCLANLGLLIYGLPQGKVEKDPIEIFYLPLDTLTDSREIREAVQRLMQDKDKLKISYDGKFISQLMQEVFAISVNFKIDLMVVFGYFRHATRTYYKKGGQSERSEEGDRDQIREFKEKLSYKATYDDCLKYYAVPLEDLVNNSFQQEKNENQEIMDEDILFGLLAAQCYSLTVIEELLLNDLSKKQLQTFLINFSDAQSEWNFDPQDCIVNVYGTDVNSVDDLILIFDDDCNPIYLKKEEANEGIPSIPQKLHEQKIPQAIQDQDLQSMMDILPQLVRDEIDLFFEHQKNMKTYLGELIHLNQGQQLLQMKEFRLKNGYQTEYNSKYTIENLIEIILDYKSTVKLRFKISPVQDFDVELSDLKSPLDDAIRKLHSAKRKNFLVSVPQRQLTEWQKCESQAYDEDSQTMTDSHSEFDVLTSPIVQSRDRQKKAKEQLSEDHLRLMDDANQGLFDNNNRLGIAGSLHRITCMRFVNDISGLTYRIGRHIPGVVFPLMDVLQNMISEQQQFNEERLGITEGHLSKSLLILGKPGVGKTTILRDIAYQLSVTFKKGKRVIIVDSNNEIAGASKVPHRAVGRSRRLAVQNREEDQHKILIQAVQNHNPEVVICDEITTREETHAVQSIAQRGIIMVATTHANQLGDLIKNPEMNSLIGGVHQVTLGDMQARMTNGGKKNRPERKSPPTFSTVIEVQGQNKYRIHFNVAKSVDAFLQRRELPCQFRELVGNQITIKGAQEGGRHQLNPKNLQETHWLDSIARSACLN